MIRRPPRSTRTDTLFPYTTLFRSNQYFTCAKIAAAIGERLNEDDPPEFVLVMPRTAEGWLEPMAMDAARVEMVREIAQARDGDRPRVYVTLTAGGDPIYVHSTTALNDERLIRSAESRDGQQSVR